MGQRACNRANLTISSLQSGRRGAAAGLGAPLLGAPAADGSEPQTGAARAAAGGGLGAVADWAPWQARQILECPSQAKLWPQYEVRTLCHPS